MSRWPAIVCTMAMTAYRPPSTRRASTRCLGILPASSITSSGVVQIWGVKFDPVAARNCSIWSLECRLVVDKFSGDKDPLDEPVWYTLFRALKACMRARLPLSNRIIRAAWFVSVAISPRVFARRLIVLRLVITERPAWFERILTTVANIASWRGSGRIHAADS